MTRKRIVDVVVGLAVIAMLAAIVVVKSAPANADAGTYNELVHWVDWMAKKYNMGTVYVAVAPLPDGVYGASNGRTITFNSSYVDDPQALTASLSSDVAYGYHHGANCTATQYLAAHESAHVLDTITGFSARYELAAALDNGLSGTVSGYSLNDDGSVNYGEALADAMAAVECDNPTPAEVALWNMLAYS